MRKIIFRIGRFFRNLLFPPKCVGCREFIQKNIFDSCEIPFCEKCRVKWEYEKLDVCPDCGLEMTLCNCGSRILNKLEIDSFVKLINYSAARKSVGKSAVFYLKRHKNDRALNYFALQLSYAVMGKLKNSGCERAVISYVPRSRKSLVEYGFDQSRELAERLAKLCDIECVGLFERTRKNFSEQKKLGINERLENARKSYTINYKSANALENADCVLILDDVLTSGASLAGCILKLKEIYNKKIICVTLARTGKSRKNNKTCIAIFKNI